MIKDVIRHGSVNLLGTILVRGMGFLLVPLYTRRLSPAEYGIVDIFMVCGALIGMTAALEIAQAVLRYFPEAETSVERREIVSTASFLTSAGNLAVVCACWFFARPLAVLILGDPGKEHLFKLFGFASGVHGFVILWQSLLRASLQPLKQSLLAVLFGSTTLISSYLLVVQLEWGVRGVLVSQFVAGSLGALMGAYWCRHHIGPEFSWQKLRSLLKFSLPLVPSSLAVWVALYVDRVALKALTTEHQLGLFGVAARFASIVGIVGVGLQASLLPLIYARHREPSTPPAIGKLFRCYTAAALGVASGIGLFSDEILRLMTTPAYYPAASLLLPLVIAAVATQMLSFSPGLVLSGKTWLFGAVNAVTAVLNTLFAVSLVPRWGARGAAFGTAIAAVLGLLVHLNLSQKHYRIPYGFHHLLPGLILAFAALGIHYFAGFDVPHVLRVILALSVPITLLIPEFVPRLLESPSSKAKACMKPALTAKGAE